MVRSAARLVAGVRAVLRRAADPAVPAALPRDLLLLSRRLLQGLLGRSAVVRGWRAAGHQLLGRALVSARHAECPPLLRLCRGDLPPAALLRCLAGVVVP